jgi:hypothetical protein
MLFWVDSGSFVTQWSAWVLAEARQVLPQVWGLTQPDVPRKQCIWGIRWESTPQACSIPGVGVTHWWLPSFCGPVKIPGQPRGQRCRSGPHFSEGRAAVTQCTTSITSQQFFQVFFFLGVLRFELRTYTLSHSISPFLWWVFFKIESRELFAQAGFESWFFWSLPLSS